MVSYAASPAAGASERCADNLKAAYVIISEVAKTEEGREILTEAMNLCTPLGTTPQSNVAALLAYLQTPLFDLAEGSYPFATDYITFALTGLDAPLPPWAMQVTTPLCFPSCPAPVSDQHRYRFLCMSIQVMCDPLGKDFGVSVEGQPAEVLFTVLGAKSSSSTVKIEVDWDSTASPQYSKTELEASGVLDVASAVAQAIQVWYNVTGLEPSCINWEGGAAPNTQRQGQRQGQGRMHHTTQTAETAMTAALRAQGRQSQPEPEGDVRSVEAQAAGASQPHAHSQVCSFPSSATLDVGTAWNALVCNEGVNLVNWWAQGTGKDMYWPPNRDRNATLENQVRLGMLRPG